jgi:hypothetical protein
MRYSQIGLTTWWGSSCAARLREHDKALVKKKSPRTLPDTLSPSDTAAKRICSIHAFACAALLLQLRWGVKMKILEAQSATLTNYEVYTHLMAQEARYGRMKNTDKSEKRGKHRKRDPNDRRPGNLATISKEVSERPRAIGLQLIQILDSCLHTSARHPPLLVLILCRTLRTL